MRGLNNQDVIWGQGRLLKHQLELVLKFPAKKSGSFQNFVFIEKEKQTLNSSWILHLGDVMKYDEKSFLSVYLHLM